MVQYTLSLLDNLKAVYGLFPIPASKKRSGDYLKKYHTEIFETIQWINGFSKVYGPCYFHPILPRNEIYATRMFAILKKKPRKSIELPSGC